MSLAPHGAEDRHGAQGMVMKNGKLHYSPRVHVRLNWDCQTLMCVSMV